MYFIFLYLLHQSISLFIKVIIRSVKIKWLTWITISLKIKLFDQNYQRLKLIRLFYSFNSLNIFNLMERISLSYTYSHLIIISVSSNCSNNYFFLLFISWKMAKPRKGPEGEMPSLERTHFLHTPTQIPNARKRRHKNKQSTCQ